MALIRRPGVQRFNQTLFPRMALIAPWLLTGWLIIVFFSDFVFGGFHMTRCSPESWVTVIMWWYITTQALGALFRAPQDTVGMIFDTIFSLMPVIVCAVALYAWYKAGLHMTDYKWSVLKNTLRFALLDTFVFSMMMAKISFYADEAIVTP